LYQGPSGTVGLDSIREAEQIQVGDADVAIAHASGEVLTARLRESVTRSRSAALLTKDEAAELVAHNLDLLGIAGGTESFGELEECLFLLPPRFNAFLDVRPETGYR